MKNDWFEIFAPGLPFNPFSALMYLYNIHAARRAVYGKNYNRLAPYHAPNWKYAGGGWIDVD